MHLFVDTANTHCRHSKVTASEESLQTDGCNFRNPISHAVTAVQYCTRHRSIQRSFDTYGIWSASQLSARRELLYDFEEHLRTSFIYSPARARYTPLSRPNSLSGFYEVSRRANNMMYYTRNLVDECISDTLKHHQKELPRPNPSSPRKASGIIFSDKLYSY